MKKLLNPIYFLLILFLAALTATNLTSSQKDFYGYRAFSINSGSMGKAIPTDSVVIVKSQTTNYQEGDIITFYATTPFGQKDSLPSTHRIFEVRQDDGVNVYYTKGDANNAVDINPAPIADILGKVIFTIPYWAKITQFTRSQPGFILLIILPVVLIISGEIGKIKKELNFSIRKSKLVKTPNSI